MRLAIKLLLGLTLLLTVALAGYFIHLDRTITATFEGRRWSIPAVVFAQPLELYAGLQFSTVTLAEELERVGYQAAPDVRLPGSYRRTDDGVEVHLRGFAFPEGARPAQPVRLRTAQGLITAIEQLDARGGVTDRVPLLRLDPPAIGSIFPGHGEDRVILTPEQVPELLRQALKAVEDQSFDQHHGFDLRGILRALLVNVRSGELAQGGSTLTQQLVKSYFLSNERTFRRKLRELAMAIILELRFSKTDLLNAYINEIYLGQSGRRAIHGFGLGAQFYFNKPLTELAPQEIATLVTIIRGPTYYNPHRYPQRVRERRDRVLDIMHRQALLSDSELARAQGTALTVVKGLRQGGTYYPAYMELVRRELKERYADEDLASSGLRIFSTLDPRLQDRIDARVEQILTALEKGRELEADSLEAAAIISDTQTGELLALAGGRRAGFDGYNRALTAQRPIGSLIKPVVYLLALEDGAHLASPLADEPVALELPGAQRWEPNNFDEIAHGRVPLVRALADSLNLATVNLGLELGVDRVAARLESLTGQGVGNPYPSLLLGAEARTPLQMQQLYATFASGGFAMKLRSVVTVLDEQGQALSHHPIDLQPAIAPATDATLVRALQTAMTHGTGKTSRLARRGVAGKTGTSDDYRDSWFAGFDDARLAVVWIGRDDNAPTGLTGASGAMRLWDSIMGEQTLTPVTVPGADDQVAQGFDYLTGYAATGRCLEAEVIRLPLPRDTQLEGNPDCGGGWFRGLLEPLVEPFRGGE
ncbi:MAG: penicillin-binding protein 1B [Pseudomonadota bacterium]